MCKSEFRCEVSVNAKRGRSLTLYRFAKGVFRRVHISPLAPIKIDRLLGLVYRAVQIDPPAVHLDLRLIEAPRSADRSGVLAIHASQTLEHNAAPNEK